MQILSMQDLPGANIFSYRPVLRIRLDLGDLRDVPTIDLPHFNERLINLLPQLQEHHCSRGYPGGFCERLQEGTYLAHVFEHVALELQGRAGEKVNFGKTRAIGYGNVYEVVVGYRTAPAAAAAAYAAEQLIQAVIQGRDFDTGAAVAMIKKAGEAAGLGPSTSAIRDAAKRRGIPVTRVGEEDLLTLGYGHKQRRVWATITGQTSALASDLASDKELTKRILAGGGIPVPEGMVVDDAAGAVQAWKRLNCPVAIKPVSGNQGKGVTLDLASAAEVERAFHIAAAIDKRVVVEEYIAGRQYRICVVNGKMAAAAERIPAYIVGDGLHSVSELVNLVNSDPARGENHEKPLTKIRIDAIAIAVLARQELTPASVPAAGQIVYIRENANLSTGGTAVDVTDFIHPDNVLMIERAASLVGLDIAGVDLVAREINKPITPGSGAVIEVNAAPGIRMHHYPSAGTARDVGARIVDYLFPGDNSGRIPIMAITGTNGKTTVSRLIGHIWQQAGYCVGMTSTDGIYIGGRRVVAGDTTGPASAKTVLLDPTVEVAVLETARGGIQRGGLGFDRCDVGIVTNITEDHFGQDGIEDLDDLIYIKSLIVEMISPAGFALLNADDPCVTALIPRAEGEVVFFTTEGDNLIVRRHLGIGGKAFFVKDGVIYAASSNVARPVARVSDIPVTLGGLAQHNIQNAVIAAAACYCLKMPISFIRRGLTTFDQNPGRLNIYPIADFRVCVDYGHNAAGYQALINTVKRLGASRLVGVIAAPGDRRDDAIVNIGRIAGRGFDWIIIKEDGDLRGREAGQTAELLRQGVVETGFSPDKISVVLPEDAAVHSALATAQPGDMVVVFYEKYENVMGIIDLFRQNRQERRPSEQEVEYEQVVVAGTKSL
ncbi:MAG: cyanophycin synthetase [Negativicutes bacterium]|nr:cyanophycin synthetase [Negativicutes bacterium]